jgi:hypothetical protein
LKIKTALKNAINKIKIADKENRLNVPVVIFICPFSKHTFTYFFLFYRELPT